MAEDWGIGGFGRWANTECVIKSEIIFEINARVDKDKGDGKEEGEGNEEKCAENWGWN